MLSRRGRLGLVAALAAALLLAFCADTWREPGPEDRALAQRVAAAFAPPFQALPADDPAAVATGPSFSVRPGRRGLVTLLVFGLAQAPAREVVVARARQLAPTVPGLQVLAVEFYERPPRQAGPDGRVQEVKPGYIGRATAWP